MRLIKALTTWLLTESPDLDLVMGSVSFDETTHRLRMGLGQQNMSDTKLLTITDGSSTQAGHNIFFSRQERNRHASMEINCTEFLFQFKIQGVDRPRMFQFVCPPAAIPSSSSKNLWGRYFGCPYMTCIWEFSKALYDRAIQSGGLAIDFMNTDDASANDRFFAAYCTCASPRWRPSWSCQS